MRLLLVEDETAVGTEISGLLADRCGAEVVVARSRDSAIEILEANEDFDLIVCDLRIPTSDGGLDVDEDHGFRIHDVARERYPGVPCIFFSGYVNLGNVGRRLADGPSVDLMGTGTMWPLVDQYLKDKQPEFIERTIELDAALVELDALVIQLSDWAPSNAYEMRPLRIYARRLGGDQVSVSRFGGLSGATVLRCEVLDSSQSSVGLVVAKVASVTDITNEISRYRQHVAPVIGIGAFAPLADEVLFGAGRYGAAFYSLATKWKDDLFRIVDSDPDFAALAVERLRQALVVWQRTDLRSAAVGELRTARVGDHQLMAFKQELDRMEWRRVEATTVTCRYAVQHGDLHGRNLLVDDDGNPLIIDYGDVGIGPSVIDPITLELSFLLHEEHPPLGGWPSLDQARDWFNLEGYVENSPIQRLVHVCRDWAYSAAGSPQEVAAMVYVHAVRQLKYPDTDKQLALAIAEAAAKTVLGK